MLLLLKPIRYLWTLNFFPNFHNYKQYHDKQPFSCTFVHIHECFLSIRSSKRNDWGQRGRKCLKYLNILLTCPVRGSNRLYLHWHNVRVLFPPTLSPLSTLAISIFLNMLIWWVMHILLFQFSFHWFQLTYDTWKYLKSGQNLNSGWKRHLNGNERKCFQFLINTSERRI